MRRSHIAAVAISVAAAAVALAAAVDGEDAGEAVLQVEIGETAAGSFEVTSGTTSGDLAALPAGSLSTAQDEPTTSTEGTVAETSTTATTAPTSTAAPSTTTAAPTTSTTAGLPPADAPGPVQVPVPDCPKLIGPEVMTQGVRYLLAVQLMPAPAGLSTFAARSVVEHRADAVRVALSAPEPAHLTFEVTSDTPLCTIAALVEVASMTLAERGGDI